MKKVLVCALAALFLMATCLTAFAVDYTTTTTYNTNGTLEIQTIVNGATEGEMYTYLAYTGKSDTPEDDDNIIYIDQQTANSTSLTFRFTSSDADTIDELSNVTVKSGSSLSDSTVDESGDLADAYRKVTVNIVDETGTIGTTDIFFPEVFANNNIRAVDTQLSIPNTHTYDSITYSPETAEGAIYDQNSGTITLTDNISLVHGTVINVIVTENEVIPTPSVDTSVTTGGRYVGYHGGQKSEKLTVFGQISNIPEGKEFGIILHDDNSGEGYKTSTRKYPAKYKNDLGQFAVQLVNIIEDGGKPELMEDLYAWIYVVDANGETIYSPVNADTFITHAAN